MYLALDNLPDPTSRFVLGEVIAEGSRARVYKAIDTKQNDLTVAIKIQRYDEEHKLNIEEEYRTLRDCPEHPNILQFYGVFMKRNISPPHDIWFILEYCHYGAIMDTVKALHSQKRSLKELHVAYIMRQVVRALVHLHDQGIMHRDVRGSNILLNRSGEIKLGDYGLSRDTAKSGNKRYTSIGSPHWMSPEMVKADVNQRQAKKKPDGEEEDAGYDNRADVWAIGITALELAEGRVPFEHMHPTRVLFQIVKNPPPTLFKVSNWTQDFNDFTIELLEKNYQNRPFVAEVVEHPFFASIPEKDQFIAEEIKAIAEEMMEHKKPRERETFYWQGYLHTSENFEKISCDDLAGMDHITEDSILDELEMRTRRGHIYTFIGDVLLSVNPNEKFKETPRDLHDKYVGKSRSENPPHIFAVADSAYEDMMHHKEDQNIIMGGESYSGKTTNHWQIMKHLNILGAGIPFVGLRIENGLKIITAFTHAGTPVNPNSTRCVIQTEMTFNQTGKSSGATFVVTNLEKLRVSTTNMNQNNFHIFYYFFDAMIAAGRMKEYQLDKSQGHRYLRIPTASKREQKKLLYCIDDYKGNVDKFSQVVDNMKFLDFSESDVDEICKVLAAILLLGDIKFNTTKGDMQAGVENPHVAEKVAKILKIDNRKFQWALVYYCRVKDGQPIMCHHSPDAARDARDTLAATMYQRLVDFVVIKINQKLAVGRALYGDLYSVIITDFFGFECFYRNGLDQLVVNTVNEQIQFLYNQQMFVWEMIEQVDEQVPELIKYRFYDNKMTVDHLMNKPNGVFYFIDDLSKRRKLHINITESIAQNRSLYVKRVSDDEFSVSHYSGKILYDARDFIEKNQDFVPIEMIETLRLSAYELPRNMFKNRLTRMGHLTLAYVEPEKNKPEGKEGKESKAKKKWGSVLVAEKEKKARNPHKLNTLTMGEYSQTTRTRTIAGLFRTTSLDLMRNLSNGHSGSHFVRCFRADLDYRTGGFHSEMVRQQMRAMAIYDTAKARQQGYPFRIPFADFITRYQFLAFDFDETVELTKDNCRLMLLRLKMEGWMIGNTKVFLKYYNVEYLSRLYEMQVKKIIRVQAMMRGFLAKKHKNKPAGVSGGSEQQAAALQIQSAYRGYKARKEYGPLLCAKTGKIDIQTAVFINPFAKRWKSKSLFQVLLLYRAARYQDLVNLSQQIHFFNQHMYETQMKYNEEMSLSRINASEVYASQLGFPKPSVLKMPFRFQDIPFFDTTDMCKLFKPSSKPFTVFGEEIDEPWDAPFQRQLETGDRRRSRNPGYGGYMPDEDLITNIAYSREPNMQIGINPRRPSSMQDQQYGRSNEQYGRGNEQYGNQLQRDQYSRTPNAFSRQSVDFNDQFYDNNNENNMQMDRNTGYKTRNTPPTPPQMYSPAKKPGTPTWKKKSMAPPPPPPSNRMNPITELQQRGRQSGGGDNQDGEDPPFNFQGMLRKTSHNRSSMKRSASEQNQFSSNLRSRDDQQSNMVYSSKTRGNSQIEIASGVIVDSDYECDL